MRHDDTFRALLRKHSPETLRSYEELPFLYLGSVDETKTIEGELLVDPDEIDAIMPFNQFAVYLNVSGLEVSSTIDYDREDNTWRVALIVASLTGPLVIYINQFSVDEFQSSSSAAVMGVTHSEKVILHEGKVVNIVDYTKDHADTPELRENIAVCANPLRFILWSLKNARDKHLVEVKIDSKPNKSKAKRLKKDGINLTDNRNLPHYIYLDAPTYVRDSARAGGTGTKKRGHNRRGTWVHLRSERYKHHPKFGGKIWRRPTWVGPKEWTVGNTIYTLKDIEV